MKAHRKLLTMCVLAAAVPAVWAMTTSRDPEFAKRVIKKFGGPDAVQPV